MIEGLCVEAEIVRRGSTIKITCDRVRGDSHL